MPGFPIPPLPRMLLGAVNYVSVTSDSRMTLRHARFARGTDEGVRPYTIGARGFAG